MKKYVKIFLALVLSVIFCIPVFAADGDWYEYYDIKENGERQVYFAQFQVNAEFGYYYPSNAANPVPRVYSDMPFVYKRGSLSSEAVYDSNPYTTSSGMVIYRGGSSYTTSKESFGNAIGIPVSSPEELLEYLSVNGFVNGGSGKQEYAYDSSIPAPKNLTFITREEGGNFIIAGTKYFCLNWTSPIDSTLMCRIDANISGKAGTGGISKVQYIRLTDETTESKVFADSGKYEFTAKSIEEKIGGNLQRMDYIRLQYYRVKDGKITVGPISTVKLHLGLFGKYTYTVTTEYPNDESDVGDSGGMDDTYYDKWTSDGENYYEYDQDGNIVDSGTNNGSIVDSFNKLINSLLNIPTVLSRLFDSITNMLSGVSALPSLIGNLFLFLPSDVLSLIVLGLTVVIALRILGR